MHGRIASAINVMMSVVVATIIALGRNSSGDGAPPPPPPPPAAPDTAPGVNGRGATADDRSMRKMPIIQIGAGVDSIFVEGTIGMHGVGNQPQIGGPTSVHRYVLASGDTLRVNGDTPAGVYDLANGGRVVLGPPVGYPRGYTYTPKGHLVLVFSVSSPRRIGVLVASEGTEAFQAKSDAALVDLFRSKAQYRSSKLENNEPLAFAVPLDWYRRGWIDLPDSPKNCRVVFVRYGDVGERPPAEPVRRRGKVTFEAQPPPQRAPVALPGTEAIEILGEVRLVAGGPATMRVEKVR